MTGSPWLTNLIAWLSGAPGWLAAALFATAFVESLAIAGILVPGVAILFAVAALAGKTGMPLSEALVWAGLGAVAGDTLSFALGRFSGYQLGLGLLLLLETLGICSVLTERLMSSSVLSDWQLGLDSVEGKRLRQATSRRRPGHVKPCRGCGAASIEMMLMMLMMIYYYYY